MTATVTYLDGSPVPQSEPWSPGDYEQRAIGHTPGTLWERVAESQPEIYAPVLTASDYAARESIPQRVERIAYDQNISRREALRVALAESRLERAKAAHPAGKGIKREQGEAQA